MTTPPISRPRLIYVDSTIQISANMQRIFFSSPDFSDFPIHQNGAHIKLFFSKEKGQIPLLPYRNKEGKIVWPEGERPITRTYTIRHFLEDQQQLVVDFVRHADFGIAADWAIHAKQGDCIGLAGPGGPDRFNAEADYFIFIGDLCAIPMIAASLEQLHKEAYGEVWIEIEDSHDQQALNLFNQQKLPPHFKIFWRQTNEKIEDQVAESLAQLDWENKKISVSLAGENHRVIEIRKILRQKYKINKADLYAVPYWRRGHTEESYHNERHHIMDDEN